MKVHQQSSHCESILTINCEQAISFLMNGSIGNIDRQKIMTKSHHYSPLLDVMWWNIRQSETKKRFVNSHQHTGDYGINKTLSAETVDARGRSRCCCSCCPRCSTGGPPARSQPEQHLRSLSSMQSVINGCKSGSHHGQCDSDYTLYIHVVSHTHSRTRTHSHTHTHTWLMRSCGCCIDYWSCWI